MPPKISTSTSSGKLYQSLVLVPLVLSVTIEETLDLRAEPSCAADEMPSHATSVLAYKHELITQRYKNDLRGGLLIGNSRTDDLLLSWHPPPDLALVELLRSAALVPVPKTKAPSSQAPSSTAAPPSISATASLIETPASEKKDCKPACTAYRATCVNGTCLCTHPFEDSSCSLVVDKRIDKLHKRIDFLLGAGASIEKILIVAAVLASPLLLIPLVVSILPCCIMCVGYFRLDSVPIEEKGPIDPSELHESWRYDEIDEDEDDMFLFGRQDSPRGRAEEAERLRLAQTESPRKSPRKEVWACSKCGETNNSDLLHCDNCGRPRPGVEVESEADGWNAGAFGRAGAALAAAGAGVQGVAGNIVASSGKVVSTVGDVLHVQEAKEGAGHAAGHVATAATKLGNRSWGAVKKVTKPARDAIRDAKRQFNMIANEAIDPHRQTFKPISANR